MSIQELLPWIAAANALITLLTALYAFTSAGGKKASSDLEAFKLSQAQKHADLSDKIGQHDSRIQAVESDLNHLPDKDAVHRLELALSEMKVEIVKIGASAEQSARTAARVETYLLENK